MCGIIGVSNAADIAAETAYEGLFALQHRGQDSAGIATWDGVKIRKVSGSGEISGIVDINSFINLLGSVAIGHVRYTTSGGPRSTNFQPLHMDGRFGEIAIVHNGNLTNQRILREELYHHGSILQTSSDTELILHLITRSRENEFEKALVDAIYKVKGAYNYLILNQGKLYVVKDPNGFRPLSLGQLKIDGREQKAWIVASETVAFDMLRAEYVRDVEPGEVMVFDNQGNARTIHRMAPSNPQHRCNFELIYLSRPDSNVFGIEVDEVRQKMGKILAIESPVDADIVVPVPDSGMHSAEGYAIQSRLPFRWSGLVRNHHVGRSFLKPTKEQRASTVRLKLNPIKRLIQGKRIVLVDDSIVRGTTCRKIVRMIRKAGAKEIHVRISSPATIGPCHYGIDTPRRDELIAAHSSVEEIRKYIEADSLAFLSVEGLKSALGGNGRGFCFACQTNQYPLQQDSSFIERRHQPQS
jgi:amidophosphoribosyltransferase